MVEVNDAAAMAPNINLLIHTPEKNMFLAALFRTGKNTLSSWSYEEQPILHQCKPKCTGLRCGLALRRDVNKAPNDIKVHFVSHSTDRAG